MKKKSREELQAELDRLWSEAARNINGLIMAKIEAIHAELDKLNS